jgi:hypothetical protein
MEEPMNKRLRSALFYIGLALCFIVLAAGGLALWVLFIRSVSC